MYCDPSHPYGDNTLLSGTTVTVKFVLHFEFFSLKRGDGKIVNSCALHFGMDLAIQLLMAPFKRRNMPFSRHNNSLKSWWTSHRHK